MCIERKKSSQLNCWVGLTSIIVTFNIRKAHTASYLFYTFILFFFLFNVWHVLYVRRTLKETIRLHKWSAGIRIEFGNWFSGERLSFVCSVHILLNLSFFLILSSYDVYIDVCSMCTILDRNRAEMNDQNSLRTRFL